MTQRLFTASKTLKSQLAAAGYKPGDITYLGLSHYHGDHTANANDFAGATWLVQQTGAGCYVRGEGSGDHATCAIRGAEE